jgi:Predicted transcriptional regulator containing an HTH domain and an uncharacterized domain shared with the mammalian protein Schlafen
MTDKLGGKLMINKPFDEIIYKDIVALKEEEIQEGKKIDYKLEIDLKKPGERKEFCADVTSFANTVGGQLIYGVKEEKGIISDFPGLEVDDKDKMKLRIESTLRDTVEPRIIGTQMDFFDIPGSNRTILIIEIPQSYSGPHMVSGQKFYGRNAAGKYALEYLEVKAKFLQSTEILDQIKQYHIERLLKLKSNEGYLPLLEGTGLLVNVLPLQSFTDPISLLGLNPRKFDLEPIYNSGYNYKTTFFGVGGYLENYGYNFINRNGVIEYAETGMFDFWNRGGYHYFGDGVCDEILKAIPKAFSNFSKLDIDGPFYILTSIYNTKEKYWDYGQGMPFPRSNKVTSNDLVFPPVFVDDPNDLSEFKNIIQELFMNLSGVPK